MFVSIKKCNRKNLKYTQKSNLKQNEGIQKNVWTLCPEDTVLSGIQYTVFLH